MGYYDYIYDYDKEVELIKANGEIIGYDWKLHIGEKSAIFCHRQMH